MKTSNKTQNILNYLDELYPNAECELIHKNPFELLIAVILSAQTTDKSVNKITPKLFEKYPTCYDLKDADLKELESIIRTIGLYHNKAINIKKCAEEICTNFNGVVPHTLEELTSLSGVGRKTANVVLAVSFHIPAFPVDTHVARVSKRLRLADEDDDVYAIEQKLNKRFDKNMWHKLHHQFIFFGRYFCKAKNPNCSECKLCNQCRYYKNNVK